MPLSPGVLGWGTRLGPVGRAAGEGHQGWLLGEVSTRQACMEIGRSPMEVAVPGVQGGWKLSGRGANFRRAEERSGGTGQ